MKRTYSAIALIALLLVSAFAAFAQTSNGTIAGTVTDATGAAVTGAKVTATALSTGEVRTLETNSVGSYRFESVLPGTYDIKVEAKGFSSVAFQAVQVTASVITSLNASLKVGQTSETVTVEAVGETLQTESGEISHSISTSEISKLPVSSLNAYALATTLPGVVTTSSAVKMTNGTEFSVNGTRPRANNFLIEGQDNNDAAIKGQGLQPQNLDAVKEVVVLTNSYAPEFGNGGGSVNNLIFKSGSNQLHGAAWEQHLNSFLNSNDHYDNWAGNPKSKFRENIFGGDVGGPIKKDKVFFFVSNQWDKYRASTTGGTLTVPTVAGNAVLQSLLTNPTTTAAQKAQINKLLSVYGTLRGQSGLATTTNLDLGADSLGVNRGQVQVGPTARVGIPDKSDSSEFISKGDIILTPTDTLSLRYVRSKGTWPYDTTNYCCQLPGFDTMQYGTSHNAGITYSHVFSPSLVNELRVSYGRIGFFFDFRPETYANPLALGPSISISGLSGFGAPGGDPQSRFHNTLQYQDSISWNKGSHSFKIGGDIVDIRVRDAIPFNIYGTIGYGTSKDFNGLTWTGLANFIDNYGMASTAAISFGNPTIYPKMMSQNYFFQDTWKMRPNLTLTYGIRYEYNGTPANTLKFPAINLADMGSAHYLNRVEQQPDKNNFGPRLGIAYTPRFWKGLLGDNKTVIRAGFGMFYDGMFTNILDNTAATAPNVFSPQYISGTSSANPRGVANWDSIFTTLQPVASPLATAQPVSANLVNPETYQWNLDIQRDLPGAFTLTTGYVGTRGTHQFSNTEANPILSYTSGGTGIRLVPDRGRIVVRDNENDSIYHALNVKLDRRFSKGFQARASYTWSKMIDTGSEIFTGGNFSSYPVNQYPNPRGATDRGLSAFDRRHALALTYIYTIPKWNSDAKGFRGGLASFGNLITGWELAGTTRFQTGAPGNVQAGWDLNGDGIANDRPILGNPNAPVTSWGWQVAPGTAVVPGTTATGYCEATYWYYSWDDCHPVTTQDVHWIIPTTDARLHNATSQNNAVKRDSFTLPGLQTWTISASKSVKVTERQTIQFRAEAFNPFNHANTGIPNLSLLGGHPWQGSAQHTCYSEPNYVGCGKPAPVQFNDLTPTVAGFRDIRFMLKYIF